MYNRYEIPVNENAYATRERYLRDKQMAEKVASAKREYSEFISNSRDYFVSESINMILQNSLDEDTSKENREYGKALVEAFVKEKGSIKLLSEMSRKSITLACMADVIKEAHQQVVLGCKEGDVKTFRITKTINNDFFEKIIGLSDEKITKKIMERVCDSLEDFAQSNVNDKLDLEELADKTKEKIENIKARTLEDKKKIEESYVMQYKKQVESIKQRANRKVGIFEHMMYTTTHNIVTDEKILESFTVTETGKLDVSKIKDKVVVMYTFLEMLNTTKLENVNESYIENVLKNM